MVFARLAELGRNRRVGNGGVVVQEEVAEELSRPQRPGADLDESQAGRVRQGSAPPQSEHLAAGGRARSRHPTGAQDHVVRHALDRRDPDELSGYRPLAEQDDRRRPVEPDSSKRVVDLAVERGEAFARIAGDARTRRPARSGPRSGSARSRAPPSDPSRWSRRRERRRERPSPPRARGRPRRRHCHAGEGASTQARQQT